MTAAHTANAIQARRSVERPFDTRDARFRPNRCMSMSFGGELDRQTSRIEKTAAFEGGRVDAAHSAGRHAAGWPSARQTWLPSEHLSLVHEGCRSLERRNAEELSVRLVESLREPRINFPRIAT